MITLSHFATMLYASTGAVTVAAYVPQIIAVLRDSSGAQSLSLRSWALWTFTSLSTFSYAVIVDRTLAMTVISFGNFLGCLVVWAAGLNARYQQKRKEAMP